MAVERNPPQRAADRLRGAGRLLGGEADAGGRGRVGRRQDRLRDSGSRVRRAGARLSHALLLDGPRTADTFLDPGFTNYADTVLYATQDVTSLIRQSPSSPAENVVATQLGSGQYDDETSSFDWRWEAAEWRSTPKLRLDLYVRYA